MVQHRQFDFLDGSLVSGRGAGVIDDPVICAVWRKPRRTEENHYVIRKLLHPGLIKEKQIAGLSLAAISRHICGIEVLQRSAVSKFRKSTISQIALTERAEVGAKDFFTHWIVIQIEFRYVRGDSFVARSHLLEPGAIVMAQGFAHGKAGKAGAIALLRIPLIAELVELIFGDRGKPATKIVAILISAQFLDIRDAVVVGIDKSGRWT